MKKSKIDTTHKFKLLTKREKLILVLAIGIQCISLIVCLSFIIGYGLNGR